MVWPAIIAGAAALGGGLMANKANAKQADKQMAFQLNMSNTAHQREVADLKAAGLNPILSGMGGQGATSAQGASAQMEDVVSPATNSALNAWQKDQEIEASKTAQDTQRATQRQLDANTIKTGAEAQGQVITNQLNERELEMRARILLAQANLTEAQREQIAAAIGLTQQQTKTEEHRTQTENQKHRLTGFQADAASWDTWLQQEELEARKHRNVGLKATAYRNQQEHEVDASPFGTSVTRAGHLNRYGAHVSAAAAGATALDDIANAIAKAYKGAKSGLGLKAPRKGFKPAPPDNTPSY